MSAQVELVRAEARLAAREPVATFWVVAFPSLLLAVFAVIPVFRERQDDLGGLSLLDLYLPINTTLALAFLGLHVLPGALAGYREKGVLRRLSTTPVGPVRVLLAQLAVSAVTGLAGTTLLLALGWGVFGVARPADPLPFLGVLVLCLLAMLGVGLALGALCATTKAAAVAGNVLFFPMMLLAGLYVPLALMPEVVQRVGELSPLGAGALAMQRAAAGEPVGWPPLLALAGWTVVALAVSVRRFRWE
ncbi:ABC transporter permease [Kineococcus indalonis]|uniref:ABC transporter permease n=1 Tax=Kineococcus indalonis TaxID=2696566 RepID=UPI0014125630|nr:ABC transporter permease [Kineococcus indalonis]NAZ84746.1 ABC transporter permease [Kineococcus indalonis]